MAQRMKFEWDTEKARLNERKHAIDFETAVRVFLDPDRRVEYDSAHDEAEDRWKVTGMVAPAVLVVICTERGQHGEIMRIISARKANAQERRAYNEIRN
jgi:uncharacterized DUF497 family protein